MREAVSIFWYRRDLRIHDNRGLLEALNGEHPVLPLFIFDSEILDKLEDKADARVEFIHKELVKLNKSYQAVGSRLHVYHGKPLDIYKNLFKEFDVRAVYCNHDYEPYASQRDETIATFCKENQAEFKSFKDQVIFEKEEVVKDDGSPYVVFTPYSKKWKSQLTNTSFNSCPSEMYISNTLRTNAQEIISLNALGFKTAEISFPDREAKLAIINTYDKTRNFPAINGTSRLAVHLRFGTISIRELARTAKASNESFLNELIWREFYMMILWHFPHVAKRAFRGKYDQIEWRNNEKEFEAWCEGKTGFPIVDAGMRELNKTGFMHNRVRMITASFLIKDLLIDWRWGEAYFAQKLLDFDLSANNGGWQWAAGSGCDAAPYFRIFNPDSQQKKFDPAMAYIKKWIPELETEDYPSPIVDHNQARLRTLEVFKKALN